LPHVDSSEALIYDFNLQVGDTTPMQSVNFETTIIHSIDTVTIFGVSLKRFWVADVGHDMTYFANFILEGIGGSNGLTTFQPEYGWLSGGIYSTTLNCFQYTDNIYSTYSSDCPFLDFVSGVEPVSVEHKVSIGPNPTQSEFIVTINEELLSSTFTLVDVLGRTIQSLELTEINSSSHLNSPGLYFWRVEHGGRLIRSGKLICE
jgi:hypothetical protein